MTPTRYLESNPGHSQIAVHRKHLEEWAAQSQGNPMTTNEAITAMQKWADACLGLDGMYCRIPIVDLRGWLNALRHEASALTAELPLPDAEGWWWEYREEWVKFGSEWTPVRIERFDGDLVMAHSALAEPKPGRWIPCNPPPSPPATVERNGDTWVDPMTCAVACFAKLFAPGHGDRVVIIKEAIQSAINSATADLQAQLDAYKRLADAIRRDMAEGDGVNQAEIDAALAECEGVQQ